MVFQKLETSRSKIQTLTKETVKTLKRNKTFFYVIDELKGLKDRNDADALMNEILKQI